MESAVYKFKKLKSERLSGDSPPTWEFWDDMEHHFDNNSSSFAFENVKKMREDGDAATLTERFNVASNESRES